MLRHGKLVMIKGNVCNSSILITPNSVNAVVLSKYSSLFEQLNMSISGSGVV